MKRTYTIGDDDLDFLLQIINLRRDRRYRMGFLQALVSLRAISQEEWRVLFKQVEDGVVKIKHPDQWLAER